MARAKPFGISGSRAGGSPVAARDRIATCADMTTKPAVRWGLVLLLTLAFKQYYALTDAAQLQWLLQPLAGVLNALGGFAFQPAASGDWLDASHGLVIVKACAGGNFLIASWLGYLWRWRDRPFGVTLVSRTLGAAWLTTLAANAVRIVLIAHGQDDLARITGLSAADSHRLIGIGAYFGALWLQLVGTGAVLTAPLIYLGVTLFVPVLNAWLSGRSWIDARYALWTVVVPLTALLTYGLSRSRLRRGFIKPGQQVGRGRVLG